MSNICAIIGIILMIIRVIYIIVIKETDFDVNKTINTIVAFDLLIILFELITTVLTHSWVFLVCTIIWIVIFILDTL